ncbi:MAG: hypothetical protein QXM31_02555 [Candidatus Woesearchaeota archaeon]
MAAAPFCIDTDNGINFTVKGGVYSLDRPYVDTCEDRRGNEQPTGESLREYYCQNNKLKWVYYRCQHFCSDGKCRTM